MGKGSETAPKAGANQKPGGASGLEIQVDEAVSQGVYSNGLMVNFNENEFTFDFLYVQPTHAKARVRARVIMTPRQAGRLQRLLADNIKKYEERFGSRANCPPSPGTTGSPGPGTPVH